MFGIFTGVIVNTVTVIIGSLVGSLVKNEKLKNVGDRVFQAFAFFVIAIGVSGAAGISDPVAVILCIVIGVAIGELVDIDRQFEKRTGLKKPLPPRRPTPPRRRTSSWRYACSA